MPSAPAQRLLVAQHDLQLSGGSLRFERLGRVLRQRGHEIATLALTDTSRPERGTDLPVFTLDEAARRQWDCTMVAGGALFPPETVTKLTRLQLPNFGLRLHHVLHDPSRREGFVRINQAFCPQVVVFNNLAWPPGSFDDLPAQHHHVLLGAVDTRAFYPAQKRPPDVGRWVVGALASKNPEPLIAALDLLEPGVELRFFGADTFGIAQRFGNRIAMAGILHGEALHRFYADLDCVAMTEMSAGWSNLVAEAMASGVAVVCTRHGTQGIARHEDTALVVDDPSPPALAAAIARLRGDTQLCSRLAVRARSGIEAYSWNKYADALIEIVENGVQNR